MKLSDLKPDYDYSKEGSYLILKLLKKKNKYIEITCDWFDYNCGKKIKWLLVREYNPSNEKKKYTNYKFENIQEHVKIVRTNDVYGKDGLHEF